MELTRKILRIDRCVNTKMGNPVYKIWFDLDGVFKARTKPNAMFAYQITQDYVGKWAKITLNDKNVITDIELSDK